MSEHEFHTVKRHDRIREMRFRCNVRDKLLTTKDYIFTGMRYCPYCGESIQIRVKQ